MSEVWVDLGDAIEGLRSALREAIDRGEGRGMHFRLAPVELTLQAVLTKEGTGKVGWKILEVGGSVQSATTQTLKLTLDPVWSTTEGVVVEDPLIAATLGGPTPSHSAGDEAPRTISAPAQTEPDPEDDA